MSICNMARGNGLILLTTKNQDPLAHLTEVRARLEGEK